MRVITLQHNEMNEQSIASTCLFVYSLLKAFYRGMRYLNNLILH